MKKLIFIIIGAVVLGGAAFFILILAAAPQGTNNALQPPTKPTPKTTSSLHPVLITAGLSQPKGMDYFQTADFLTKNGMNVFPYAVDWKEVEPTPNQYDMRSKITNPLTLLVPKHPQFKGVVLVIKMIDTNARVMPPDLQNKLFDDPEVKRRFLAMLHAIAGEPSAKKITHILLGNEVDSYFSSHPNELSGFLVFLKASIDQIHKEMPGVKVGTITGFDSLVGNSQLFGKLNQYSDFVNYTYYPVSGLSRGNVAKGWQMKPISEIGPELVRMAKGAGARPFSFTEIGYSASPLNASSEDLQAAFVKTVFDTLDPYRKENRVEFISWSAFADVAPEICQKYASYQGIEGSKEFCAFMDNLGLRTYEDNQPRKAWDVFVARVKEWTNN